MPIFRNIKASVRPARCAILINENLEFWELAVIDILGKNAEVWGGKNFLIIPTDGTQIHAKFWELLDAYSPDHIALYHPTFANYKVWAPERYERARSRYKNAWTANAFGNDFEDWFEREAKASSVDEIEISTALHRQLVERLSPFHLDGDLTYLYPGGESGFGYPLTKVAEIAQNAKAPIHNIVTPTGTGNRQADLLICSRTGLVTSGAETQLERRGVAVEPSKTTTLPEAILSVQPNAPSQNVRYPFDLSMLHLVEYYRIDRHANHREPTVVVLGDSINDFCFYYSLSRMHERVFWIPLKWLRDCASAINLNNRLRDKVANTTRSLNEQQAATSELANLFFKDIEYGHHQRRIELRSLTLSVRQLVSYRRQLAVCSYIDNQEYASKVVCKSIESPSTECINRVFEENNYNNDRSIILLDRKSVSPIATPTPKNFNTINLPFHRWVTSLEVQDFYPPAISTLGVKILDMPGPSNERRAAADGIAYQCPNWAYFGGDVDTSTVRPRVSVLDDSALIDAFFASAGIQTSRSDKGNYVDDALSRFGGLRNMANFLHSTKTRRILDMFMSSTPTEDGNVIHLTNDQRTYLTLQGISAAVGHESDATDIIDDLVSKRVLFRGYILQCERCRLASWYILDELTASFACNRCSHSQQFTRSHWKTSAEPKWYYKLAETVYQTRKHNSHITILTLGRLLSESRVAFHFTPEIRLENIPNERHGREIDIACIVDGRVIIGECKTEVLKPRHVALFGKLLNLLPHPPNSIVFATDKATVSDAFLKSLASLRTSVRVMANGDLFGNT